MRNHSNLSSRRSFLGALATSVAALSLSAAACKKDPNTASPSAAAPAAAPARCSHCGMKLPADSAWLSELVAPDGQKRSFDTPRCAITAKLAGGATSKLRVQDFYDRKWRDASEVLFVTGSDVVGPMGPDLVPVDAARAPKFMKDHQGEKSLRLDEVTKTVLEDLK